MRKWILGLGVLAIVLGGLFLMGYITIPEANASDMDITFYDVNGEELGKATTTGLSIFGIRRAGFEGDIYSVKVAVHFTVTTDINYTGIETKVWLEVDTKINFAVPVEVHRVDEHLMGSSVKLEDTIEATYLMSELLPDSAIEAAGKANGWKMAFSARLKSVVGLPDGDTREVDDTCGITLDLTWSVSELNLDSYMTLP